MDECESVYSRHEAFESFLENTVEWRIVYPEYDPEEFSAEERALQQGALNAAKLTCELLPIPTKYDFLSHRTASETGFDFE